MRNNDKDKIQNKDSHLYAQRQTSLVETDGHHGGREPERVVHRGVDKVERLEVALVVEGGRGGVGWGPATVDKVHITWD